MVLSGDPMQLSPIFQTKRRYLPRELPELYHWMASDVLTARQVSLFDASEQKKGCILLVQQGRMHPKILAPLNHLVYQGMLLSRPETEDAPPIGPCPQWPLMLVDSSHAPASQVYKPSENQARINEYHAHLAIALIPQILSTLPARPPTADPSMPRIGILAPYASQVNLIWQFAHQAGLAEHIHVGTVNSVQALEFEVVIFDTVEAPTRRLPSQRVQNPFHFTFDRVLDRYGVATHATRLLNVAHSRARHKLIYLAHQQHLHRYQPANPKNDPAKQRLLVDLVDWAAREGSLPSATVLAKSLGDAQERAG
jgi:superfamily I DNA and/or RNA helicase